MADADRCGAIPSGLAPGFTAPQTAECHQRGNPAGVFDRELQDPLVSFELSMGIHPCL